MSTRAADEVRRVFERALARVAPAGPVERAVAGLDLTGPVVLLALGKAAAAMASGAEAALGPRIAGRVVVVPVGTAASRAGFLEAAHPAPDARSEAAGRALLAAAARAGPDQEVLALVSGGGSALAAVPADGIALADKAAAIARLMDAGAPIAELNTVRRHLSAIKGGRLARASRARVTTLVVSDVVGDALHEVASGPTVPDPTRFADACEVIERRVGAAGVAPSVWQRLEAGRRAHPDPEKEDAGEGRAGDRAVLLLGRGALVESAADEARRTGDGHVEMIGDALDGEVTAVAAALEVAIDALVRRGGFLVAGGEPTVELPAGAGRSGRAHHLALLLARALDGRADDLAVLVAGSDGVDGASGAAGAIIDPTTWRRIRAAGRDPARDLAGFDAAAALAAAGAQVTTGPTGVNHADLVVAWAGPARFS